MLEPQRREVTIDLDGPRADTEFAISRLQPGHKLYLERDHKREAVVSFSPENDLHCESYRVHPYLPDLSMKLRDRTEMLSLISEDPTRGPYVISDENLGGMIAPGVEIMIAGVVIEMPAHVREVDRLDPKETPQEPLSLPKLSQDLKALPDVTPNIHQSLHPQQEERITGRFPFGNYVGLIGPGGYPDSGEALKHRQNQDGIFVQQASDGRVVLAVLDGNEKFGHVGVEIVTDSISRRIEGGDPLALAVANAPDDLKVQLSQTKPGLLPKRRGERMSHQLGVCGAFIEISSNGSSIVFIGDCKIEVYRPGWLWGITRQIKTVPHSLRNSLIAEGLAEKDINPAFKNVVTRRIQAPKGGIKETETPEVLPNLKFKRGDIVVLYSDGLECLERGELDSIVSKERTPDKIVSHLQRHIHEAHKKLSEQNRRRDDYSVVVFAIDRLG
jgi:serine/threonine protein phosphatase PrpC